MAGSQQERDLRFLAYVYDKDGGTRGGAGLSGLRDLLGEQVLLGGFGFGGVVTGPLDMDRSVLASQGVSEWVLAIQVRNRGRMPVDVGSFEVEFESGGAYNRAGWHVNPNLPYRLEPGSSQSFYVPLADVEKALEIMNRGRRVRGRVGLGDGRTVYTARVTVP